jgi:hypothetical protein
VQLWEIQHAQCDNCNQRHGDFCTVSRPGTGLPYDRKATAVAPPWVILTHSGCTSSFWVAHPYYALDVRGYTTTCLTSLLAYFTAMQYPQVQPRGSTMSLLPFVLYQPAWGNPFDGVDCVVHWCSSSCGTAAELQLIHFVEAAWKLVSCCGSCIEAESAAEEAESARKEAEEATMEAANAESACGKSYSSLRSTLPRVIICYVCNQTRAPRGAALPCTPFGSCGKLSWR